MRSTSRPFRTKNTSEMQPYIELAERLGSFLSQVSEGTLEEISVRYSGHIGEWKTELSETPRSKEF